MTNEDFTRDGWNVKNCQCIGNPKIYTHYLYPTLKIKVFWSRRNPDFQLLISGHIKAVGFIADLKQAIDDYTAND